MDQPLPEIQRLRFSMLGLARHAHIIVSWLKYRHNAEDCSNQLISMAFSIEDLRDIDLIVGQWCLEKVPPHLKKQVDHDYEIDGQSVTIFEVRPAWRGQPGETTRRAFAKFRYVKSSELWHIYWMRQTGKWESYELASAACSLEEALDIIDMDSYGCFFG